MYSNWHAHEKFYNYSEFAASFADEMLAEWDKRWIVESKQLEETVTFHCLTEYNDWEGETWYHYFQDEPGVYDTLSLIQKNDANDYTDLETISGTWAAHQPRHWRLHARTLVRPSN